MYGQGETLAKIALLKSDIAAKEAYSTNLGSTTDLNRQKLQVEQALEKARQDAAASPDPFSDNIPMPVAVRPNAGVSSDGSAEAGAAPAIVDPNVTRAEHARAALHSLWPLIIREGNSPTETANAVKSLIGTSGIYGGTMAPNAVSPDDLRLYSTLATGSAPTESTVMTSNDLAGPMAKAAGAIATERANPTIVDTPQGKSIRVPDASAPGGFRLQLLQGGEATPLAGDLGNAVQTAGQLNAKKAAAGGVLSPADQTTLDAANALIFHLTNVAPILRKPDEQVLTQSPAGLAPAAGVPPPSPFAQADYGDQVIATVTSMYHDPAKPPIPKPLAELYRLYAGAKWGLKNQTGVDANGQPYVFQTQAIRSPGVPGIEEVDAAAGLTNSAPTAAVAPAAAPAAAAPAAAAPAVPAGGGVTLGGGAAANVPVAPAAAPAAAYTGRPLTPQPPPTLPDLPPKSPTETENKDRGFASNMRDGTQVLDSFKSTDVPSGFIESLINTRDPTMVTNMLKRATLSPEARQYAQAAANYANVIYQKSGAAFSEAETQKIVDAYIQVANDDPLTIARKKSSRHQSLLDTARAGFATDRKGFQKFMDTLNTAKIDMSDTEGHQPMSLDDINKASATGTGSVVPKEFSNLPNINTVYPHLPDALKQQLQSDPEAQKTFIQNYNNYYQQQK